VQRKRVLVLGAGFGGLEVTSRLAQRFGPDLDLVLVDQADSFVFGFSKLDVMFGRTSAAHVRHLYRDAVMPDVRFVQTTVRAIDPTTRSARTDAGDFEADVLVIALGADLDPSATPGLLEGGHEFYTVAGAFALRDVLAEFGGGRVIVAVTSTPFKCPPAPSETALLMHDLLRERGLRDDSSIALVSPLPVPIPPSPQASQALLAAFAERGIEWHPNALVRALDPSRHMAVLGNGDEMPYDLFLGVPKHQAPTVAVEAGLTVDGWIPVDPLTLETAFPDVFAIGDVTSVGTPKAGVYAEGQAAVVAERIIASMTGAAVDAEYDGHGTCYIEMGSDQVGRVDVTFRTGQVPSGQFDAPSAALAADKIEFGRSRVARWFDRNWEPIEPTAAH
jgi:sulfide:quinone oxidoreductase